ncbi:MAG: hypothetical protein M4579_001095 [Chaenotheca gracillima]|nr:MAG: hypothetical protein M4579_001095 [Chaenotheca gracillima]
MHEPKMRDFDEAHDKWPPRKSSSPFRPRRFRRFHVLVLFIVVFFVYTQLSLSGFFKATKHEYSDPADILLVSPRSKAKSASVERVNDAQAEGDLRRLQKNEPADAEGEKEEPGRYVKRRRVQSPAGESTTTPVKKQIATATPEPLKDSNDVGHEESPPREELGLEKNEVSSLDELEQMPLTAMQQKPLRGKALARDQKAFPTYEEFVELNDKAEFLPDIIHIPFEEAVSEETLEGWEDEWLADGVFDPQKWGRLKEPKIDFVYTWVNGSEEAFKDTIYPYELNSSLNDGDGVWIKAHRQNRYRDWDELRYSMRSIEKHAGTFRNKIQILVNAIKGTAMQKQSPLWLKDNKRTKEVVEVLSQEDFFEEDKRVCLPTFNSLTIENQIFATKSDVDRLFALSDDMLLGKQHAASDIFSPLYGGTMGFKTNGYSTTQPPTEADAKRFGEKPYLIYTSWLLNRRFGNRKRKGQAHFGHSLSRTVTREAIGSFPRPELKSACQRFRGESGFQLYSWYATFHYTIERHREVLLWSYLLFRSDPDQDGNLSWEERQVIMADLEEGMANEGKTSFRARNFYHVAQELEKAGLEAPKVNIDIQWTSLDGPAMIRDAECLEFNVDECLAPGFSTPVSDARYRNPVFSTATIFDRVSRQEPRCGDCLTKLLLNRVQKGLSPMLPHVDLQPDVRQTVIKALKRYQYSLIEPDAFFVMVSDAEQVENVLLNRFLKKEKKVGQLCMNDDVASEDEDDLEDLRKAIQQLFEGLFPQKTPYEAWVPRQ